ncbi:MAG: cytochrome c oxidase assembly factor Coa1 family protein [Flavobacterium sp.]
MDANELIKEKKWWAKRKWFLLAVIVLFTLIFIVFVGGLKTFGSFRKAYVDKPLFDRALNMVKNDSSANVLIGKPLPLDYLATANGSVDYSDNDSTLTATIPVKGSIKMAKMDIVARKFDGQWEFETVKIRIKDPKKEIDVLANQE